jgi:beta-lactamase regulating signal transducer with metallopeptidase domain
MAALLEIKGFTLFLEFFLKSSLILAAALSLSFLLKKQSASLRHFLLGLSLVALLFLPFLSAIAPGWQTDFLPSSKIAAEKQIVVDILPGNIGEPGHPSAEVNRAFLREEPVLSDGGKGMFGPTELLYRYGLMALWVLVTGFIMVKILFGLYGAHRLTRQGVSMRGYPWQQLFLLFLEKMALKRSVRLFKHKHIPVPITWGVLNPVVLMPAVSSEWAMEQCSSALCHELSHVKRKDFLVLLLSRISCCLYWFNPLSWLVFRRLEKEQEKACDEMVLKAGVKPSIYASSLLRIKQAVDRGHLLPAPALGMTGHSEFKERLTTILAKQKTKEMKMKSKIMLLICVFLAVTFIGTAKPNPGASFAEDETAKVSKTKAPEAQKAQKEKKEKKEKREKKEKKVKKEKREKKEKEVLVVVEKGEGKEVKEIIVSPLEHAVDVKMDEGHYIINKSVKWSAKVHPELKINKKFKVKHVKAYDHTIKVKGKEGEGDKYIVVTKAGDKEEEEHEIIEIKNIGADETHLIILKKGTEKGEHLGMTLVSENKIGKKQVEKIKTLVETLRKNLPKSFKLESTIEEDTQSISILWPLDESEDKEAMKHIKEFEEAFKKVFPSSKDKKPLMKKLIIYEKERGTEV